MKVGFTGTRRGMTDAQRSAFGTSIYGLRMTEFRHGSCQGADVQAARIIADEALGSPRIISHPGPDGDPCREVSGVDNETLPPLTHFARNRDIVDATELLIACPFDMEEQDRGGTWMTVNYARKKQKPVIIIWPDGSVKEERL